MAEKILVVDDDFDSLNLISVMLQRQGYAVIAANAGGPAIQKAITEQPNLIILDVMMPDMDGYEVCRRLRAESSTATIPIIMFTAKSLMDDKVAGFEAGADDYLTKPTHPMELSSRVKAVLERVQLQPTSPSSAPAARSSGLSMGFLGVKGGVGTSTLAANVGALLAKEAETVLADLRPGQGTLALAMGFPRAQGLAQIMSRPAEEITPHLVEENSVVHNTGLRLILSSIRPPEAQLKITPEAVFALLNAMKTMATYRLLDLGCGLNRLTVKLLRELDHLTLLVEPNPVTLDLARELMRELSTLQIASRRISLVVYNRSSSNLQVPWQDIEQLLDHEVTAIISPAPELAFQAGESGIPMVHYQPNAVVTGQFTKLAEEYVKLGQQAHG